MGISYTGLVKFFNLSTFVRISGPVYGVEGQNKFTEILTNVDKLKNLTSPVYDMDRNHSYAEIEKNIQSLQNLSGPVYTHGISDKHHFSAIAEHAEQIKKITYPVMEIDRQHHYNEIEKSVKTIKSLVGPFYDV